MSKNTFTVIDVKTGEYPDLEAIALHEDWAKGLVYCDMEGFAIEEDGSLLLMDECDNSRYCPIGRFEIVWEEQEAVEQKWTSVKERYPEEEGFYLVSAENGNYHPWIAEMRIFRGIKGFCNGATMPVVGAWMPLPKPYKSDSSVD